MDTSRHIRWDPVEPAVDIRSFTMADYDAVRALWRDTGLPFRPEGRDARGAVESQLAGDCAVYLVAVVPETAELVGVVFGTHDGRKGWINRLAVARAWQRHGLAGRLVAEVEARLAERGIDIVAASIESGNEASLAFFAAAGYVHDRDIEYVSKRRHPAI